MLPPQAVIIPPLKETDYIRGDIEYELRTDDWKDYLPTPRQQKFKFDTNECTQLSGVNNIAIQLNFLKDKMPAETLKWFSDNGYLDEFGKFALSERFTAIKANTSINGNSNVAFWDAVKHYGILPRKDLSYTLERSNLFETQELMCADYYDPKVITQAMESKATKSLDFFKVLYEYSWFNLDKSCPLNLIEEELKHAPLHLAVPVCSDWNTGNLHPCGKTTPAHAIVGFDQNDDLSTDIMDQYTPWNKLLSEDYFIPVVVKGVVSLKTLGDQTISLTVLQQFIELLKKIGLWTIKGLRGVINV